ncbi:unnamed protein product, partial [Allacma fusca]
MRETPAQ